MAEALAEEEGGVQGGENLEDIEADGKHERCKDYLSNLGAFFREEAHGSVSHR